MVDGHQYIKGIYLYAAQGKLEKWKIQGSGDTAGVFRSIYSQYRTGNGVDSR